MKRNLSKQQRIKDPEEIKKVFRSSQSVSTAGMKIFFFPNNRDHYRYVLVPQRKYGNAVQRNKVKRQLREALFALKEYLLPGYDMAIVIYSGRFGFSDRLAQLKILVKKIRGTKEPPKVAL